MPRTVGIGHQDFEQMIMKNNFYIDKTMFIKEWWENDDDVTLITRPRRFGKMLNLNMTACFFSVRYAGRSDLFQSLSIWRDEKYRKLQRTYPVIFLSFAGVKETSFPDARKSICQIIEQYHNHTDDRRYHIADYCLRYRRISKNFCCLIFHCINSFPFVSSLCKALCVPVFFLFQILIGSLQQPL